MTNVFLVLPTLPLAIVLAAFLPYKGPLTLGIVIGVTGWSWGARVMRSQTLSMRGRDFVEAAQARGETTSRIIFFEILPNETALVAAELLGTIIYCILAEAGLEFLGLGNFSSVSWGTMFFFAQNNDALLLGAWWWFLPPGICIALLGAALALVNFGIDEIANPRLRTERGRQALAAQARAWRSGVLTAATGGDGMNPPHAPHATAVSSTANILEIRDLSVEYASASGTVHALNNVSLALVRGQILGLAGESGSGKTTLGHAIARLLRPPAAITGGQVLYYPSDDSRHAKPLIAPGDSQPIDILQLSSKQLRAVRWSTLAIVFQSAMNALNPVMRLSSQIDDVLKAHRPRNVRARAARARAGTARAGRHLARPHEELSTRVERRYAPARDHRHRPGALPEMIIMDEPTTALDVVVQREILMEIARLRERFDFSVIFITHDLSLLLELADKIAIMYAGRRSRDGYPRRTEATATPSLQLWHAALIPDDAWPAPPNDRHSWLAAGSRATPAGCAFHPRCPMAFAPCATILPRMRSSSAETSQQLVACHLYDPRMRAVRCRRMPTSARAMRRRMRIPDWEQGALWWRNPMSAENTRVNNASNPTGSTTCPTPHPYRLRSRWQRILPAVRRRRHPCWRAFICVSTFRSGNSGSARRATSFMPSRIPHSRSILDARWRWWARAAAARARLRACWRGFIRSHRAILQFEGKPVTGEGAPPCASIAVMCR